ncbi:methyltransferase domain-containing protein, partial [Desulfovibrio sp.]
MGVSLQDVHVLLGLWKDGHFPRSGKVMELGSQEMHLPYDLFEAAVEAYGVPGYDPEQFQPWEWESRGRCCFASVFYRLLGFSSYSCLDLNQENNAVPHDLNFPMEDVSLWNSFDMVTDFGCAEHAFNVGEAFRTMHRLCRPGGVILSHQMILGGNGYYLFEPGFYEDLAAANGYEVLFCALSASA